jgi:hypothetical protein
MRRGLGLHKGRGYYNLIPIDHHIHSISARGIKSTRFVPIATFRQELRKKHIKPFSLPVQTAILVPSTKEGQELISSTEYKKRILDTRKELYDMFGGFTSVSGSGGTEDLNTKELVEEPVNVVYSYAEPKTFRKKADEFIDYVEDKKKKWGQQSMGVIIENDLLYI